MLLGVLPMGSWSMTMTFLTNGGTFTSPCLPIFSMCSPNTCFNTGMMVWFISVLFPEPETPVIPHSTPRGRCTVSFLRLFSSAPETVMQSTGVRLSGGISIFNSPERYLPVRLLLFAMMSVGEPSETMWPPWMPAPGPMSTMWSAFRMVSSSCSTTISVFPRSRSRWRVLMSLALSF